MIRRLSSTSSLDEISGSYDGPVVDPMSVPKVLYGHRASIESLVDMDGQCESRVLVIYTGGTIGMVRNERGKLAPIPKELELNIRRFPHMHDECYASHRFGHLPNPPLVLPDCREKRRVLYWVYEYDPLLDSSNMTMDDWIRIARDIRSVYEMFDGFVVLHGTDTLAYTASALSFMLENLGKTVVITGSQIPIFETRSDGRDNFIGSVIMAGHYVIPEVGIFFNSKLYRGNRTTKVSTRRLQAFDSPNMNPLAVAGISIQVDYRTIFRSTRLEKFRVHDTLSRHVGLLRICPSISAETVRAFLLPPIQGAVLQTYGAGNMPSNRNDIMEVLKEATERGVLIVNTTQCMHGGVEAIYETGEALEESGVLPGLDMTPEAALSKLAYVISKKEWDRETKIKMMQKNIRGEMTSIGGPEEESESREIDVVASVAKALQLSASEDVDQVKELLLPTLFFAAVVNADITRLSDIFENKFDLNLMDHSGWTALHIACVEGHMDVVEWLLHRGASVHVKDRRGHTPLWAAIENDRHKVIDILVQTGAHLTESPTRIGEALCMAAGGNNVLRLSSFKFAGVDLNIPDSCGRTPLHAACTVGADDCVKLLLKAGVQVDIRDRNDLTPSMCAQMNNNDHLVDRLAEHEQQTDIMRYDYLGDRMSKDIDTDATSISSG